MGRWTPLILMAGGLAILLGTLLGISFPMGGGQNTAQAPGGGKTSRVLPANINVNSTATSTTPAESNTDSNKSNVAQNNTADDTTTDTSIDETTETTTAQSNSDTSTTDDTQVNDDTNPSQNDEPIRALW
ncbi:MAG: hypothetical protein HXY43_15260 [Fischerella sp.]|jgi:hypothetical protein|uniref:hypothetical protein n=1 Tax=Fischerella sp. TaxID=1191 RepID=UPI0017DB7E0A|nr:hypothetical protein [Fischerella sp.]NWF60574.1 hypothetical protein [Fischerella sp.]